MASPGETKPSRLIYSKQSLIILTGLLFVVTILLAASAGNLTRPFPSTFHPKYLQDSVENVTSYNLPWKQTHAVNSSTELFRDKIQKHRIAVLRKGCADARQNGVTFKLGGKSPIYNDNYRFIFSAVPKVATTSWKRVFLVLQGQVNSTDSLHHKAVQHKFHYPKLSSLSTPEANVRVNTYTKVLFVREPFHRILSAYRNKLENIDNSRFRRKYGTSIIAKYRKNPSLSSLKTGSDVTFLEFVKYLADPQTRFQDMDMHWTPIFVIGRACNMNYDIIGKFEKLQEDALYVLEKINARHVVTFPSYDTHVTNSSHDDTYSKYYSTVPEELLSRLYKKYELDFTLFDYDKPQIIEQDRVNT
uniref:Carbohydrate sulfotransferase n=1 Tax=Saccoglossus kowalevskii TaxID=10224 RepID=A0ABM0M4M2_SACKO|nr:PREDICTED: carbohydrate sulfotransferase 11-like [Saccoglossus kowalevskii]